MPRFNFVLLILFINHTFGELLLKKGTQTTVQFDGNDLIVRLSNYGKKFEEVRLCFGSFSKETEQCPSGYVLIYLAINSNQKTTVFKLNRHGTFKNSAKPVENIRFNDDNSLDVMLFDSSENVVVTLENAGVLEKNKKTEAGFSKLWIGLSVGGIFLIFVLLLIGFAIWFFLFRKKSIRAAAPAAVPQIAVAQKTIEKPVEKTESVQYPPPEPIIVAVKSNEKTTMTKRTSSSTTKASDEKMGLKQAIAKPRVSRSVSKETKSASIETPAQTVKSEKTQKSSTLSTVLYTSVQRAAKPLPPKIPPPMIVSPSLPVDVTQSPTHSTASTDPTPEFSYGINANHLALNSAYKSRPYLPFNEAPRPGSSRQRSAPIIDEVVEFKRTMETYYCFAQREKIITGHEQMMMTERVKMTAHHKVSDAERKLLKAAPKDAPKLADALLREVDECIRKHPYHPNPYALDMQEHASFWRYVNEYNTMASVGFVILYRLLPGIFALKSNTMNDPRVKKMPLSGLYILLLDSKLPQKFREELASELRNRAAYILPRVQKASLRETCFPTTYLTLLYYKNKKTFVRGMEVHSKNHISSNVVSKTT